MSVAASRAPSAGIEAMLAAMFSTPVSKTSSSASASALASQKTAPFPDLFGQMLETQTEELSSSSLGAALESKLTTAAAPSASKKTAVERNPNASGTPAPDTGQAPVAADAASAQSRLPWLPLSDQLAFPTASTGPFSANGDIGGAGAANQASAPLAGAYVEVAAVGVAVSRPVVSQPAVSEPAASQPAVSEPVVSQAGAGPGNAAYPGQAFVGNSLLWARSERPLKQGATAAGMAGAQATGPAPRTGPAATAAALESPPQSEPEPPSPLAVTTAMAGNTETAAGAARRAAPDAASNPQASVSALPASVAAPSDPVPQTRRTAAKTTRNIAEPHAADPAAAVQAASSVAAEAIGKAASQLARLVTRTGGQSSEPDEVAPEQVDAAAAAGGNQLGGDRSAAHGTLAFQALLVPGPAYNPQLAVLAPEATGNGSGGANPPAGTDADSSGGRSGSGAPRDPDLGPAVAIQTGQASGTGQAPIPAAWNAGAATAQETGRSHGAAPTPASPSAASAAEASATPKPAAGGAAREIRLELRDADARVDVRLVERAGVVQVDVRTPDSHLAESLRSDLPALSARLEQTGLRAETWHDAPADAATRIKVAEPASSAGFQSSQNQSRREGGGHDPRDGQPQEKRQNQPHPEPKEFSWLYTSLT